uniref:Radical SAM domain protein n=1 Tax=Solibacter usitatus (strain Ellin6076) TaxID=234267 RepID=Q02BD6_SOLUE
MQRIAEIYLFDTCTMKCGYCSLAESGKVLDSTQLERFRDPGFIDHVVNFFNSRTTAEDKWNLLFTGGEPLITPNLAAMCRGLFSRGNKVSIYTGLYLPETHVNFRFVLEHGPDEFDYLMASLHPETEADEGAYWRKVELLKGRGHKVFVRFVGHPNRLHRLSELAARCRDLDVCFYPTTLLSDNYPRSYTDDQRGELSGHFSSLSQFIQLRGGLSTNNLRCHAGKRMIAVNMQTGNITPCITVGKPILGNIFENSLDEVSHEIECPVPGINCCCDVHFQQDIVAGAKDEEFGNLKLGFAPPRGFDFELARMRDCGIEFYGNPKAGIGSVTEDGRLFYSIAEVKASFHRNGSLKGHVPVRAGEPIKPLFRLEESQPCNQSRVTTGPPFTVTTAAEQWSYAAVIPVAESVPMSGAIVRLKTKVVSGAVGIGILNADLSVFVTAEQNMTPEDSGCDLFLSRPEGRVWLVVRNVSPSGSPSCVEVNSVEAFQAAPLSVMA